MEEVKFVCPHIDGYETIVEVHEEGTMIKIVCAICGTVMKFYFVPKE